MRTYNVISHCKEGTKFARAQENISTTKREITAGWRKRFNKNLDNLRSFCDVIRVMNCGKGRWVEHAASIMGDKNCVYIFCRKISK
jgi:hypothetical protein